jgi:adenylyltransferase/sulfurtransferase
MRELNDQQLHRYARQLVLPEVDFDGQARLLEARVLIIGMGGLGSPAALYLAGAGVGELVVADHDRVDLTNLHRQVLHHTADVGRPKAESARDALLAVNPDIRVTPVSTRLEDEALAVQVAAVDLVLDCTDNFDSRFAINAACAAGGKPLVAGAAIRFEGQVTVFRLDQPDGPCYRCLYREAGNEAEHCAQVGVLPPVVGVIGAMQALEALKVLLGMDTGLAGRLLLFDGRRSEWHTVGLRQDPDCPVCRARRPAP